MQINRSFARMIASILTLAMLFGMVPMGMFSAFAADTELTWHEITTTAAQTVYKRVPLDEFVNYVTTTEKAVPIYIGFGDETFYSVNNSNATIKQNDDGGYSVEAGFSTSAVTVTEYSKEGYYLLSGIEGCSKYYIYSFNNGSYFGISNSPSYTGDDSASDDIFWLGLNIWWLGGVLFQPTSWMAENEIKLSQGTRSNAIKIASAMDSTANNAITVDTVVTEGIDENGNLKQYYTSGSTEIVDTEYTDMYVYVEEEIPAATTYAALYSTDYTYTYTANEITTESLLNNLLPDIAIRISDTRSLSDEDYRWALNESATMPNCSFSCAWDKELDAGVPGTYVMTVSITDPTNVTTEIGEITVIINEDPYAVSVSVAPATVIMPVGKTASVTATTKNADGYSIKWTSSDVNIATVAGSGTTATITAVATGTIEVTANLVDSFGEMAASAKVTVYVPSVTLSATPGSVSVGSTFSVAATTNSAPSGITISWSSSDGSVATVDVNGFVTTHKAGTATITAKLMDGETVLASDSVEITVSATIAVTPNWVELNPAGTAEITASVAGADASDIVWSSDDEEIATVSGEGAKATVTGVKQGSTTIKATVAGVTAQVTVQVKNYTISISPSTVVMEKDDTATLTATVTDVNGNEVTGQTITWSSSSDSIVGVSGNGSTALVTALAEEGSATITAAIDGAEATASVTVEIKKITVSPESAVLTVGDSLSLAVQIVDGTDYSGIEWKIPYDGVISALTNTWNATNCSIIANKAGETVITVSLYRNYSELIGVCEVNITVVDPTLTAEYAPIVLSAGSASTVDFALKVIGGDGNERDISNYNVTVGNSQNWEVKDGSYSDGKLTLTADQGAASGTYYIKVYLRDKNNNEITYVEVPVKVLKPEHSVKVEVADNTLYALEQTQATATITKNGTTVTDQVITWTTSDSNIATVDANGVITAVAPGSVTITATLADTSTGSVSLTVQEGYVVVLDTTGFQQDIQLDVQEEGEQSVEFTLGYLANLPQGVTATVSYDVVNEYAEFVTAEIVDGKLVLTAVKETEKPVSVTVKLQPVTLSDGTQAVMGTPSEYTFQVSVTDDLSKPVIVTLNKTNVNLYDGNTDTLEVVSVTQGTNVYAPEDYTLTWKSNRTNVATVGTNGVVAAVEPGSTIITATVNVDGAEGTAKATVNVMGGIDLGTGYREESGYVVPVGTKFTIVPQVDLADEFSRYQVEWTCEAVDGTFGAVTFGSTSTMGGLSQVDSNTQLQYITNAMQTVTADAVGKVRIKATLVDVDGTPLTNVSDWVYVTIVDAATDTEKITEAAFYNRNTKLYTPTGAEGEENPYELRILDEHTFQPDTNGLDARIGAVAGDTRVDFSQVKVAVYKNGELLLDSTGNPFIIPTSELSFYDVSTDQIGWVKVRVTYKDYYAGEISLFKDGGASTVDGFMYDEYTTGEGGTDGYVWMYVRPKEVYTLSDTVFINGEQVTVTMTIEEIRPWLGEGIANQTENWADTEPFCREDSEESSTVLPSGERIQKVTISYSYKGSEYVHTNVNGNSIDGSLQCPVDWDITTSGGLTTGTSIHNMRYAGQTNVAEPGIPAYGEVTFFLKGITLDGTYVELDDEKTIPVLVRDNTLYEDAKITFGYTSSWGNQATAYKSFLGSIPISSYAISYVADISQEHFQIGVVDVPTQMAGGSWHEWFSLNVPLGTTAVETTFHTVTRNDGVVFIFNPDENAAEVDYTIELNPQMLVLSAFGKNVDGYSNTGTLTATVKDADGNLLASDAIVKVEWKMRNSAIASAQENASTDAFNIEANTGKDVSVDDSFVGPNSNQVTVAGQNVGVTYLTVQLMEIKFSDGTIVDAADYGIADYAIIYVIDGVAEDNLTVVVDYGKPIEIDLQSLMLKETNYNFIGFSDLEHSLRKEASTEYGTIRIEDNVAQFSQTEIMQGMDSVYVIFEYIEKVDNQDVYRWHHHVINIIPATMVYYETDFAEDVFTTTGEWEAEGTTHEGYQDSYVSGNVYGYDSSYDSDAKLSDGSSLIAYGEGLLDTTATFSFTGTGFDVISRTGKQQATIVAKVYSVSDTGTETLKKTITVVNKGVDELYQIPVISCKDLEHGTYKVVIGVMQGYTPPTNMGFNESVLEKLTRGNEFYFDAVRIYGTMHGTEEVAVETVDNVVVHKTVDEIYAADGEKTPAILPVGQQLINANTFNAAGDSDISGMLYLDDSGDLTNGSTDAVADYDEIGPNNEVYLAGGKGIAFILEVVDPTLIGSIDIGVKTIQADNANLVAVIRNPNTNAETVTEQAVGSATSMFYAINGATPSAHFAQDVDTGKYQAYILIRNTGTGVLSITDIKIGFKNQETQVAFLSSRRLAMFATARMMPAAEPVVDLVKGMDGNWYYHVDGEADTTYTGLVEHSTDTWYVLNGQVQMSYTGLVTVDGERYYVKGGRVNDFTGLKKLEGTWLYFVSGKVDTEYAGLVEHNGVLAYVENGEVDFNKKDLVEHDGQMHYVKYGLWSPGFTGMMKASDGVWRYVKDGLFDDTYVGLAKNSVGWWYVQNGLIDSSFTGFVSYGDVQYYVKWGQVMLSTTGVIDINGAQYYIKGGSWQSGFSGTYTDADGVAWKITNGLADASSIVNS